MTKEGSCVGCGTSPCAHSCSFCYNDVCNGIGKTPACSIMKPDASNEMERVCNACNVCQALACDQRGIKHCVDLQYMCCACAGSKCTCEKGEEAEVSSGSRKMPAPPMLKSNTTSEATENTSTPQTLKSSSEEHAEASVSKEMSGKPLLITPTKTSSSSSTGEGKDRLCSMCTNPILAQNSNIEPGYCSTTCQHFDTEYPWSSLLQGPVPPKSKGSSRLKQNGVYSAIYTSPREGFTVARIVFKKEKLIDVQFPNSSFGQFLQVEAVHVVDPTIYTICPGQHFTMAKANQRYLLHYLIYPKSNMPFPNTKIQALISPINANSHEELEFYSLGSLLQCSIVSPIPMTNTVVTEDKLLKHIVGLHTPSSQDDDNTPSSGSGKRNRKRPTVFSPPDNKSTTAKKTKTGEPELLSDSEATEDDEETTERPSPIKLKFTRPPKTLKGANLLKNRGWKPYKFTQKVTVDTLRECYTNLATSHAKLLTAHEKLIETVATLKTTVDTMQTKETRTTKSIDKCMTEIETIKKDIKTSKSKKDAVVHIAGNPQHPSPSKVLNTFTANVASLMTSINPVYNRLLQPPAAVTQPVPVDNAANAYGILREKLFEDTLKKNMEQQKIALDQVLAIVQATK